MSIILDDLDLGDLLQPEPERLGNTDIASAVEYSLSGRAIIWEGAQRSRPITLQGGDDFGWISRATMDDLMAMAGVPGATYSLTLHDGSVRQVRFRHEDPPVITGTPIIHSTDRQDEWLYAGVVVKLSEVA